ncbi:MAG: hypothetical protein JO219_03720 [Candidatus Eremiobacteraeota bacterium]|nr:hypothetical protein [Candidatus Eremiobacteraeota bacterium]MBV8366451.1 hypothetical protein [Candidatus Eremiobacteraeota bacterium]
MSAQKKTWPRRVAAVLSLVVLAALLPEVGSGNTPISAFLSPHSFFFLTIIGYGIPVLLIRELAVRRNLGTAGIVIAGFAYAFYNEGLWAKTMILTSSTPVASYSDYGVILGIAVPWALGIGIWHALASVLFPILFVNTIFPKERDKPWFDPRLAVLSAIVLLAFAGFAFMQPYKQAGTLVQLAIFESLIVAGTLAAWRMQRTDDPVAASTKPFALVLGLTTVIPFLLLSAIAGAKLWLPVFVLGWLGVIVSYTNIMKRRSWQDGPNLMLFGLGFYVQTVFFATLVHVGAVDNALEPILTGLVLEIALVAGAIVLQVRLGQHHEVAEEEPEALRPPSWVEGEQAGPAPAFTMLRARQASEGTAQSYPQV